MNFYLFMQIVGTFILILQLSLFFLFIGRFFPMTVFPEAPFGACPRRSARREV